MGCAHTSLAFGESHWIGRQEAFPVTLSLTVIYQSPKPLLPTFSVRLHSVRMHPTWNIRFEGLVVQIPHFVEEEIAGELSTGPVGIPEQGYPWAALLHSQSCKEGCPCSHNIWFSWFLSRLQAMNDWRFWLQAARSGHRMSQPLSQYQPTSKPWSLQLAEDGPSSWPPKLQNWLQAPTQRNCNNSPLVPSCFPGIFPVPHTTRPNCQAVTDVALPPALESTHLTWWIKPGSLFHVPSPKDPGSYPE